MLKITVNTKAAQKKLEKIKAGLDPKKVDAIVAREAAVGLGEIKLASPRLYFGQLQAGWRVKKAGIASHLIYIPPNLKGPTGTRVADIALWVNEGTANNGQGFIYPKFKRFLYLPLNRNAALGWTPGLKRGVDYVLRDRVRGQVGQHFIEPVFARVRERTKEGLKEYVRRLIQGK